MSNMLHAKELAHDLVLMLASAGSSSIRRVGASYLGPSGHCTLALGNLCITESNAQGTGCLGKAMSLRKTKQEALEGLSHRPRQAAKTVSESSQH